MENDVLLIPTMAFRHQATEHPPIMLFYFLEVALLNTIDRIMYRPELLPSLRCMLFCRSLLVNDLQARAIHLWKEPTQVLNKPLRLPLLLKLG